MHLRQLDSVHVPRRLRQAAGDCCFRGSRYAAFGPFPLMDLYKEDCYLNGKAFFVPETPTQEPVWIVTAFSTSPGNAGA